MAFNPCKRTQIEYFFSRSVGLVGVAASLALTRQFDVAKVQRLKFEGSLYDENLD